MVPGRVSVIVTGLILGGLITTGGFGSAVMVMLVKLNVLLTRVSSGAAEKSGER